MDGFIETPAAHAAALWTALSLLVLLVLSVLVVRQRAKHKVVIGDGGVPELMRAQRAFGNATEYVPAAIGVLAVMAIAGAPAAALHIVGGLIVVGRIAHAVGLTGSASPTLARAGGILLTWIAYIFAIAALLFYAVA